MTRPCVFQSLSPAHGMQRSGTPRETKAVGGHPRGRRSPLKHAPSAPSPTGSPVWKSVRLSLPPSVSISMSLSGPSDQAGASSTRLVSAQWRWRCDDFGEQNVEDEGEDPDGGARSPQPAGPPRPDQGTWAFPGASLGGSETFWKHPPGPACLSSFHSQEGLEPAVPGEGQPSTLGWGGFRARSRATCLKGILTLPASDHMAQEQLQEPRSHEATGRGRAWSSDPPGALRAPSRLCDEHLSSQDLL